jgi:hypothetical protein
MDHEIMLQPQIHQPSRFGFGTGKIIDHVEAADKLSICNWFILDLSQVSNGIFGCFNTFAP